MIFTTTTDLGRLNARGISRAHGVGLAALVGRGVVVGSGHVEKLLELIF